MDLLKILIKQAGKRAFFLFIFLLNIGICFSQKADSLKTFERKNEVLIKPNTLSTHPLGLFISRINHDFKIRPVNRITFSFNVSNGNVWLPHLKGYMPINEVDRLEMQEILWYRRLNSFDFINSPSQTIEFHADALYRVYQMRVDIPISLNQDLQINVRSFSIDKGELPYSAATSDQFIEWFHTTIYGGDDPFARRVFGFNQADVYYTDEDGNSFHLREGDFVFHGLDISYHYYPKIALFEQYNIFTNLGMQLGVNVTNVNPGLDLACIFTGIKKFEFNERKDLSVGLSMGLLNQGIVKFNKGLNIVNNDFIFSTELLAIYKKQLRNNRFVSFGTNYFIQSPYNKKDEFDYIVITGEWRYSTHWHYALTHLYRILTDNSFVLTYGNEDMSLTLFLREDLLVDNAPDVQTGLEFKIAF